jgi:hypothetical protein
MIGWLWILVLWIAISTVIAVVLRNVFNYDVELNFIWYDLWIGIYYDREKKIIYINSLPCVVWICERA